MDKELAKHCLSEKHHNFLILYEGLVFRQITLNNFSSYKLQIQFFTETLLLSLYEKVIKQKGCLTFQQKTWNSHYKTAHLFPISVPYFWFGSQYKNTSNSLPNSNLYVAHYKQFWTKSTISSYFVLSQFNFPPEILSHSDNWCTHKCVGLAVRK
jgi:hypothetical protein